MRGTYIGNNKMLINTVYNRALMSYADDLSLTPVLVTQGGFEIPLVKYMVNNVKNGMTVFDVGANIGFFTVLMGALVGSNGKVVAYEASKRNHDLLVQNLSMNYVKGHVDVLNKAAYSKEDKLTFYSHENFNGNSSIVEFDAEYEKRYDTETVKEETVIAEPLDVHFNKVNKIDLIKIDVEGSEYDVIIGMEKLLKTKKVKKVVFELNKLRSKGNWEDLKKILRNYEDKFKYKFFVLNQEGVPVATTLDILFQQEFIDNVLMELK